MIYYNNVFFNKLACRKENADLKARISDLEAEKSKKIAAPPPVSVIREGVLHDSGHLPPLAPLELPQFDFSVHQ